MVTVIDKNVSDADIKHLGCNAVIARTFEVSGISDGGSVLSKVLNAADSLSKIKIPQYGESHPASTDLRVIFIWAGRVKGFKSLFRVVVQ